MILIHLLWTSSTGPHDEILVRGLGESPADFAARAKKWAEDLLALAQPTGCVRMTWCSNGTAHDEQICPNAGESPADFIARAGKWIRDQLTDFPPTNDCP